jgi:Zn-dependent peptidase ImmA (M78 family)
MRVHVEPTLLRWARERAGISDPAALSQTFPKLQAWEAGDADPTLKQLERFARAVHIPVGYLFLATPPIEHLPIPDFRTVGSAGIRRPSPDLLDMLYACQERQAWYREYAQTTRQPEMAFVGRASLTSPPEAVAAEMRRVLEFDVAARATCQTWEAALRQFIKQADRAGVLVMISGVVLSNTRRRLDPNEFRGFALADRRAPLVFVNGSDTKAAQMFTLAHELAHLWLGTSAVSNASARPDGAFRPEEVWCNRVAAEFLVPLDDLREHLELGEPLEVTVRRLTRRFKVSSLVILRRLLDAGRLTSDAFEAAWQSEIERLRALMAERESGGDFYLTALVRLSRRFARALIESTMEGHTLYRDAYRMLGVTKVETFQTLAHEVGLA